MQLGKRFRRLALQAVSHRRVHNLEIRAELAVTSAIEHIRCLRHPRGFSGRWKYTRRKFLGPAKPSILRLF